jgi:hypothetical protein
MSIHANDISDLSSILNNCDKDQLNKYLNDDESLDLLVENLNIYQIMQNEKSNLTNINRTLAKGNLNKQPEVEQLKQRLASALEELDRVKNEYLNLIGSYSSSNSLHTPDMSLETVYTLLDASANKAEEETDKLAEDFFLSDSGQHTEDELNQIQKLFLELRTNAHLKKIKADKMKELLATTYH